jgi:molybdenum cofactor guanylyltransferase
MRPVDDVGGRAEQAAGGLAPGVATLAPPTPATVAGLILAGGRGSRLGGEDKGLVCLGRQPLVAHVIERLAPQVQHLMVSANRNLERYALLCPQVIHDELPDYQGPLAGILAGLRVSPLPWVMVVPCDAPHLPGDLVQRLVTAATQTSGPVVAAGQNGPEPAFALWPRSLADALARWLASGQRRLQDFQRHCGFTPVPINTPGAFANINTFAELADTAPP